MVGRPFQPLPSSESGTCQRTVRTPLLPLFVAELEQPSSKFMQRLVGIPSQPKAKQRRSKGVAWRLLFADIATHPLRSSERWPSHGGKSIRHST
jgi:hypothetical protein